jgi:predicted nucleic acid-binding protein
MYSFDTNVFVDWQARYYPLDVFGSLETRMEALIAERRCVAVELVHEEIRAVGTPGLQAWSKAHKTLFVPLSAEVQAAGAAIEANYPDLMDPKGLHESADAYVIALARHRNGIVVSQETSAAEKHKPKKEHYIPDVCRELGVPCINLLGVMRREGWKL